MPPHSEKYPETVDLFRSQLDQIINMEHELVQLAYIGKRLQNVKKPFNAIKKI